MLRSDGRETMQQVRRVKVIISESEPISKLKSQAPGILTLNENNALNNIQVLSYTRMFFVPFYAKGEMII